MGLSQLRKLPKFLRRRCEIAAQYDETLDSIPGIKPLGCRADVQTASQSEGREFTKLNARCAMYSAPDSVPVSNHAYHLYAVRIDPEATILHRDLVFRTLRKAGVGVNVHYIPVHLHPYYRNMFKTTEGQCPVAEDAYSKILSLPIFPDMSSDDVDYVVERLRKLFTT